MKRNKVIKYLLVFIIFIGIGCNGAEVKTNPIPKVVNDRKFVLLIYYGDGMQYGVSALYCDSLKMTSYKSAKVYIDGVETPIFTDKYLTVMSNE